MTQVTRAERKWCRLSSLRQHAGSGCCSPAVVCSMHRKRTPSRRIVDFQGDPLAALQSALERPPSPSPFQPSKDDGTESVSRESSASGARLPLLRYEPSFKPCWHVDAAVRVVMCHAHFTKPLSKAVIKCSVNTAVGSCTGGKRLLCRSQERMNQTAVLTTYRDCTAAGEHSQPVLIDPSTPIYDPQPQNHRHEVSTV